MAILGYNTIGAAFDSMGTGRMLCSKATLASAATLTELHGYFHDGGSPVTTIRLVIYLDGGGINTPIPAATLVAYSNPILLNGGTTTHAQQTGFSVALAAGDYWIGARSDVAGGFYRGDTSVGAGRGIDGATDPPPNPFGIGTSTQSVNHILSMWAVVGAAAGSTFVPQIVIT